MSMISELTDAKKKETTEAQAALAEVIRYLLERRRRRLNRQAEERINNTEVKDS